MKKYIIILAMALLSVNAFGASTQHNFGGGYTVQLQIGSTVYRFCKTAMVGDKAVWNQGLQKWHIYRWMNGQCRFIDYALGVVNGFDCSSGQFHIAGRRMELKTSGWQIENSSCPPLQWFE